MDVGSLILHFFLGAVGMAWFVYGKKQSEFWPMLSGGGIALTPWFTDSMPTTIGAAVVIAALPFVMARI